MEAVAGVSNSSDMPHAVGCDVTALVTPNGFLAGTALYVMARRCGPDVYLPIAHFYIARISACRVHVYAGLALLLFALLAAAVRFFFYNYRYWCYISCTEA
jgi:hypothetical protein